MGIAVIVALVTSGVALVSAAVERPFVRLPRWHKHRLLVAVSGSSCLLAACDAVLATELPDETLLWAARGQAVCGALLAAAWLQYAADDTGLVPAAPRRGALVALGVLGLCVAVPGWAMAEQVVARPLPELGLTYRLAPATPLGLLLFATLLAALLLAAVGYGSASIRGLPHAFTHFVALLAVLVTASNDALVRCGIAPVPFLLDLGLLFQVTLLAIAMGGRWARDLERMASLASRSQGPPSLTPKPR